MSQCSCCMSPQEDRVINKNINRQGRERVYKILERNQFSLPHVDVERAKYFTESMRETEGELLTLRWAKALKNVAEKITVWITPDQLLAGRVGKLGRYGILYPEIDGDFYREVLADLEGMQTLRLMADNMAWLLNCREASGVEPYEREVRVKTNFYKPGT